ncbi:glypican-6 [Dendroctonus ponderosae]|nr:glypican-6 [Dendroctonus ponderosae]
MAVIRIDSVRGNMCRLQGVLLFCALYLTAVVLANPRSCDSVKSVLESKGFASQGILDKPQNGFICGEDSCCNDSLENDLKAQSHSDIEKYLKDTVVKVATLVETRARKFDEIFRSMMNNSKREFHEMFERTYGKIYLDNAEVFSDFFNELETYYKKGTVRLADTMDTFFGILYQRMFTVINSQYNFDETYIACVNNHMQEVKPFGDVPHKLTQQLKRAFVATRTFYKSLTRAAEAIREAPSLHMDEDCARQLTLMQVCGVCRGETGAGSCSQYCIDTIASCMRNHIQLSDSWDNFVAAIDKVADRLTGPYNVDSVVEPLNIKISEAIMNFQEVGAEVSQKIQQKCGTLGLKRPSRSAGYDSEEDNTSMELKFETMKMGGGGKNRKHKKVQERVEQQQHLTLEKLIEDIKIKIKTTKQFWVQLPYQYCNNDNISAGPSDDGNCWNGTTIGSYNSPTFKAEPTETPQISGQIHILNGLTEKLRKAYHGQDVEIIDDSEETFEGSGSGSGDEENEDTSEETKQEGGDDDLTIDIHRIEEVSLPPVTSTFRPEVVRTSSANVNSMSLTRALIQFLLPMVMVWFGGAIKDLL